MAKPTSNSRWLAATKRKRVMARLIGGKDSGTRPPGAGRAKCWRDRDATVPSGRRQEPAQHFCSQTLLVEEKDISLPDGL